MSGPGNVPLMVMAWPARPPISTALWPILRSKAFPETSKIPLFPALALRAQAGSMALEAAKRPPAAAVRRRVRRVNMGSNLVQGTPAAQSASGAAGDWISADYGPARGQAFRLLAEHRRV